MQTRASLPSLDADAADMRDIAMLLTGGGGGVARLVDLVVPKAGSLWVPREAQICDL